MATEIIDLLSMEDGSGTGNTVFGIPEEATSPSRVDEASGLPIDELTGLPMLTRRTLFGGAIASAVSSEIKEVNKYVTIGTSVDVESAGVSGELDYRDGVISGSVALSYIGGIDMSVSFNAEEWVKDFVTKAKENMMLIEENRRMMQNMEEERILQQRNQQNMATERNR